MEPACGPVDLLVGADLFPAIIIRKPRHLGANMPYLIETRMGPAPTQLHPLMVLMAEFERGSIAQPSKDFQNTPIQTFSRYSYWTKTKRVLAYILRAITRKKTAFLAVS